MGLARWTYHDAAADLVDRSAHLSSAETLIPDLPN